jgi:flagellar hook-length control protein FliK
MQPTTTTNIKLGTLLDVLGVGFPTSADKGQSVFDALLQPPSQPPVRRTSPDESPDEASQSSSSSDDRGDDPPKLAVRPESSSPRHEPVQERIQSQAAAPAQSSDTPHGQKQPSAKPAEADKGERLATDDSRQQTKQDEEPVVAESLAGLTVTTVASQTSQPQASLEADKTDSHLQVKGKSQPAVSHEIDSASTLAAATAVQANTADKTATDAATAAETADKTAAATAADANQPALAASSTADTVNQPKLDSEVSAGQPTADALQKGTDEPSPDGQSEEKESKKIPSLEARPEVLTTTPVTNAADATPATPSPTAVAVAAPLDTATNTRQPSASQSSPSTAISGVTPGAATSRSRLPGEVLSSGPTSASRRPPLEVDTTRLLTRVARAFAAANERDGEVHLRLSPPELGSLKLDIRVTEGVLTAHLQTETQAAKTALIDNLPALRERLADQGIRVERFDVDLMQRQPGGMPDQPGGRQQEVPQPPVRSPLITRPAATPQVTPTSSPYVGPASGLNVIV